MNELILIAVVAAVLYGLWLLLDFTFTMIENYHATKHAAADRSSEAASPTGERGS
jgi:hypothetical protein